MKPKAKQQQQQQKKGVCVRESQDALRAVGS